mmetsp:Transcript_23188/g.39249  ORF Transcript_23188/g.39249 Transcript_23188/m.39249 type:complete len:517 (-) Transcript_23188:388-1938(-)
MDSCGFLERVIQREQQLARQAKPRPLASTDEINQTERAWQHQLKRHKEKRERLNEAKQTLSSLYVTDNNMILSKHTMKESFLDTHIKILTERESMTRGMLDESVKPLSRSPPRKEKRYRVISKILQSTSFQHPEIKQEEEEEEEENSASLLVGKHNHQFEDAHPRHSASSGNNSRPSTRPSKQKPATVSKKSATRNTKYLELFKDQLLCPDTQPSRYAVSCDMATKRLQHCSQRMKEGDESAREEYNKWRVYLLSHPERERQCAERKREWVADNNRLNDLCLQHIRATFPPGLSSATLSELRQCLPPALASRAWSKLALWLVQMSAEDISRLDEADLASEYTPHGLDEVELRAVWAALPEQLAGAGRMLWRESFLESVMEKCRGASPLPHCFSRNAPAPVVTVAPDQSVDNDNDPPSQEEVDLNLDGVKVQAFWEQYIHSVARHPAYSQECPAEYVSLAMVESEVKEEDSPEELNQFGIDKVAASQPVANVQNIDICGSGENVANLISLPENNGYS